MNHFWKFMTYKTLTTTNANPSYDSRLTAHDYQC